MKLIESFKSGDIVLILLFSIFLVHVFYLGLFFAIDITPMMWLNVGSVAVYMLVLFLHIKGHKVLVSALTSTEISIHQIAGTYFAGFDSGFALVHLCLFLFQFSIIERWSSRIVLTVFGYAWILLLLFNQDWLLVPYKDSSELLFAINIFVVGTFMLIYGTLATLAPAQKISELIDLVYHDQLTGLFNRKYFLDKLNPKIQHPEGPYILAICDIDNFKQINDTYGHESGDLALRLVSNALLASRAHVVRWGGEEFVLLASAKDYASSLYMLDEVRKSVCDINFLGSKRLSISIGAVYQDSPDEYQRLLAIADAALYRCKQGSKNCIELQDISQKTPPTASITEQPNECLELANYQQEQSLV